MPASSPELEDPLPPEMPRVRVPWRPHWLRAVHRAHGADSPPQRFRSECGQDKCRPPWSSRPAAAGRFGRNEESGPGSCIVDALSGSCGRWEWWPGIKGDCHRPAVCISTIEAPAAARDCAPPTRSEWPDTRPSVPASAARRWTMARTDTVLSRPRGRPALSRRWNIPAPHQGPRGEGRESRTDARLGQWGAIRPSHRSWSSSGPGGRGAAGAGPRGRRGGGVPGEGPADREAEAAGRAGAPDEAHAPAVSPRSGTWRRDRAVRT